MNIEQVIRSKPKARQREYVELLSIAASELPTLELAVQAADAVFADLPDTSLAIPRDAENPKVQAILRKTLAAASRLSEQGKRELKKALEAPTLADQSRRIVDFVNRYRVQLASLLSDLQLAAVLQGMREVARRLPAIPPPGVMPSLPPSLSFEQAVDLLDRIRPLQGQARAEAVYKLTPDEQHFVNRGLAAEQALPASPPRIAKEDREEEVFVLIDEAAKTLGEKNAVTKQDYDRLDAATKAKSFTVAGVDSQETLEKIRDVMADQIQKGVDVEEFRKNVIDAVGEGTFLSDGHLETVFRTNVQGAFSDGQMTLLKHPFVRSGFPYATIDPIHDDRVEDTHLAMDKHGIQETNVYRIDDPVFQMFRPPWRWNCRCGWNPLSIQQAADQGIQEAQEWLRTGVEPATKAFVKMPPWRPPADFVRPAALSVSEQPLEDFMPPVEHKTDYESDRPPEPPLRQKATASIAIIGGGPAGLFTAWHLQKHFPEARVTIFEASERYGGKIVSACFSDGTPFEAGVAELYEYKGSADPLRKLIEDDLGLQTVDMNGGPVILGEKITRDLDEVEAQYGKEVREDIERFHQRLVELMPLEVYAKRWQLDNEHPWAPRTFLECLTEECQTELAKQYILARVHSDLATEPHTSNGLNGIKNVLMDNADYLQNYHIWGGIEQLPRAIASRVSADIRLLTRVSEVRRTGDDYTVVFRVNGRECLEDFSAVICALPNQWLSAIKWPDELNSEMQRIIAHYDMPAHYLRVTCLFKEAWWTRFALGDYDYWMTDCFNGHCHYNESHRWRSTKNHVLSWLLAGNAAMTMTADAQTDEEIIKNVLDALPQFMQECARQAFIEGRVDRYVGALNAQPGGWPAEELRDEHQPNKDSRIFLVGDYFFDSTLNGCLISSQVAVELLMKCFGKEIEMVEVDLAVVHAPPGGVTIGGTFYEGGKFIPSGVLDKLTPEQRKSLSDESAHHKPAQRPRAGKNKGSILDAYGKELGAAVNKIPLLGRILKAMRQAMKKIHALATKHYGAKGANAIMASGTVMNMALIGGNTLAAEVPIVPEAKKLLGIIPAFVLAERVTKKPSANMAVEETLSPVEFAAACQHMSQMILQAFAGILQQEVGRQQQ